MGAETWPTEAKGVGFTEAPRGALGHWVKIKDGKIDNYQCVVPTTWNGSPRDPKGNIGAFEAVADEHADGRSRTSRWKSCAPCIPSIPASPARPT